MRLACSPARIDRPASRLGDSVEPVTPAKVDHPESRDTAESQDKLLSAMRYQFGGHMKKRAGNGQREIEANRIDLHPDNLELSG